MTRRGHRVPPPGSDPGTARSRAGCVAGGRGTGPGVDPPDGHCRGRRGTAEPGAERCAPGSCPDFPQSRAIGAVTDDHRRALGSAKPRALSMRPGACRLPCFGALGSADRSRPHPPGASSVPWKARRGTTEPGSRERSCRPFSCPGDGGVAASALPGRRLRLRVRVVRRDGRSTRMPVGTSSLADRSTGAGPAHEHRPGPGPAPAGALRRRPAALLHQLRGRQPGLGLHGGARRGMRAGDRASGPARLVPSGRPQPRHVHRGTGPARREVMPVCRAVAR